MATFVLTPGVDVLTGSAADDEFIASNSDLNAGDRLDGGSGNDLVSHFLDANLAPNATPYLVFGAASARRFSAFELRNIDTFSVVNDSNVQAQYDLSSSDANLTTLRVTNSTNSVVFDQVNSLAAITLENQTAAATADVAVGYRADLLDGATTVRVNVINTNVDELRIGAASAGAIAPTNAGVETVNLVATGSSTIRVLDTAASTLTVDGAGNIAVTTALNNAIRTITSTGAGNRGFNWSNNGAAEGVTYNGSQTGTGVDTIVAGAGADTINTFGGNDNVDGGAGNDTINAGDGNNTVRTGAGTNSVTTGSGNDTIFAEGVGGRDTVTSGLGDDTITVTNGTSVTINAGDGNDKVIALGGSFNASAGAVFDVLNMGAGTDILEINAGAVDAIFAQVTQLDFLVTRTAGTTTIGSIAQAAGINSVYFATGNVDDVLNAGTYTVGLTVSNGVEYGNAGLGGNDTVTTGSGADALLFRGNGALTNDDRLNGGTQTGAATPFNNLDALYLQGTTALTQAGGAVFQGIEYIALETSNASIYGVTGSASYNLTLINGNAPTSGPLIINASSLLADNDGAGARVNETLTVDATAVSAFSLDLTGGFGGSTLQTQNTVSDRITILGGNNTLTAGGAAGATGDIIDVAGGNNVVTLINGNNRVTATGANNTINFGAGNETLFLGAGNDTIVAGANLTGADSIGGGAGAGNDTLRVFGRNYTDADFAGLGQGGTPASGGFETLELGSRAGDVGAAANDEVFSFVLGANAARGGFTTIRANGTGVTTIDAGAFGRGVTFDLSAGGNDSVIGTGFDDVIIAGAGNQFVSGGAGADRLRVSGSQLDNNDTFQGGAGLDVVELDNTGGAVNASVNLTLVTSVERYEYRTNGNRGAGVDADANVLRFGNAGANTVTNLTPIAVDFSALTDSDDSSALFLDVTLVDADFAFNITGSSTLTRVVKENTGINNNINYQGGSGVDVFEINGGDLGSTTIFNGAGGQDIIIQTGGVISDDSYVSVSNVEVLRGTATSAVLASLGSAASASGLNLIQGLDAGAALNDNIVLDAAFTSALRIELGGGDDVVNGSASSAAITFAATDAQLSNQNDILSGGTTANDVIQVRATGGTARLQNMTGVETILVLGDNNAAVATSADIVIDTAIAEVAGGSQTITANSEFGATDILRVNGTAATANLTINAQAGADVLYGGSGNDTINGGAGDNDIVGNGGNDTVTTLGGADLVLGGAGNDTVNAGAGSDVVDGGADNDTVNGEAGNDFLRGGAGADSINGGADNDGIQGGAGLDTLTGGAGADIFYYNAVSESSGTLNRDRITDFTSGSDRIDVRGLTGTTGLTAGSNIVFRGNFANFTDAQGAVTAGDGVLEAVYQQDLNILWFDSNDDGALNANDLQIVLTGVGAITGADIFEGTPFDNGAAFTAFDANFTAPIAAPTNGEVVLGAIDNSSNLWMTLPTPEVV